MNSISNFNPDYVAYETDTLPASFSSHTHTLVSKRSPLDRQTLSVLRPLLLTAGLTHALDKVYENTKFYLSTALTLKTEDIMAA